jgi:hypothetical protein
MATEPDEELSVAANETLAAKEPGYASNLDAATAGGDELLSWVARRFRFDPSNRRSPQPGVSDLQKELSRHGVNVMADGVLGAQTIDAITRLGPSLWLIETEAEAASTDFGTKTARQADQQAKVDEPEPEPATAPVSEAASARPVALSDAAISDIDQDRLGFLPYVEAVAEFILAEQTRPPLAIAINAPWGQGKTSFMRMLDAQLRRLAPHTTTRVATTWFNPWKYSEPEQVWAAFVANVTRCLRDHLTRRQSWRFRLKRLGTKLHRHADLSFVLRVIVALIFVSLVASAAFMDWTSAREALLADQRILQALYAAATNEASGYLWYISLGLVLLLAVVYAYVALSNKLGLNLLEYVEKTDFKDKIGTLSQFEHEMLKLREAVPDDLKVVVFIDDLDRCKGKVLGEIIEALQLAEVSHTCIFVMGMDLHIVANAIEKERAELALSAGGAARMEHGSGYKFLEKIIQARLALPVQGPAEMERLVAEAMAREGASREGASRQRASSQPGQAAGAGTGRPPQGPGGIVDQVRRSIGLARPGDRETPSDSEAVIASAKLYGSRHFDNPRRLKRFINGFRLQAYLTAAVRPGAAPIDRLARFLVLAEKWPAIVDYMLEHDLGSLDLLGDDPGRSTTSMNGEISELPKEDRERLYELLDGADRSDPLTADEWQELADWYGFGYYRGIAANAS